MTRNEVMALGFTPMQIEIYLPPPPAKKKIITGSKREGNKQTIEEQHWNSEVVHRILRHLKKYTSVKLG